MTRETDPKTILISRLIRETGEWIEEEVGFSEFVEIFLSTPVDSLSKTQYNGDHDER